MSNVIKAINIRYTQEKREIDSNERAEGFKQLYIENLARAQEIVSDYADEDFEKVDSEQKEYDETEGLFVDMDSPEAAELVKKTEREISSRSFSEEEVEAIVSQERDQMLDDVAEECERLRSETRDECDRIIAETREMLEAEQQEAYERAEKEGYNAGVEQAQNEYEALKQELAEKIAGADDEFAKKVDELEPAFVDLTINLIRKITGILVDDRRDLILHIIRQSMLDMEKSANYIIHVSKDDFDFVNSKKQDLMYELKGNTIEVVEDPILERAQCTIETDTRVFDCSLDVQLKNLIADLKLLAGE